MQGPNLKTVCLSGDPQPLPAVVWGVVAPRHLAVGSRRSEATVPLAVTRVPPPSQFQSLRDRRKQRERAGLKSAATNATRARLPVDAVSCRQN